MSPARTPFENWVVRYGKQVIRYRWPVAIATVLTVIALAAGAVNLGLSSNYRVFFSADNPDLEAFEAVQNIYTKNDNILFVVTPTDSPSADSTGPWRTPQRHSARSPTRSA